ncbi:MAG: hypothetical protein KatS3mg034_1169 [Vicingaceae bacterium]|nr:MAG: hypothetical protein KatS3mg034_1169 [Vicingaceae bacterium]
MAVYRIRKDSLFLTVLPMYGEKRLGVIKENRFLMKKPTQNGIATPVIVTASKPPVKTSIYPLGKKHYETTDWLGNVRVTYTDKKSWSNGKFALKVSSSQDYYPFGSVMEGRDFEISNYRFGWQNQERTDEISGAGNHYTAKFWEYNPRVVTRWNTDPVVKPWQSPYVILSNSPIWRIDPNGDDDYKVDKKGNISLVKETDDEKDNLFAVDDDGNMVKDNFITVDKGILDKKYSQYTEDDEGNWHKYDILKVRGDDKATELFKFLANNTDVEWSQILLGEEGEKGLNYLTTSHEKTTERGAADMFYTQFRYGYTVRGHNHNHPSGNPNPSGEDGDIGFLKWVKKYTTTNKPIFQIYTAKDNTFHEYNEHGRILKIELPAIEIKADPGK